MKIKKILLIAIFGTFFVCGKQQQSLKQYMTQSWQTTYLKIEMPTYNKSVSPHVYEDKFDNNPKRIAQSKYNADGTFSAWYINPKGEKISESKGKWKVIKDSLFIEYSYGGKDVKVTYKITKTEEGFIGKSKSDWDNDGESDDILTMKTKRIK